MIIIGDPVTYTIRRFLGSKGTWDKNLKIWIIPKEHENYVEEVLRLTKKLKNSLGKKYEIEILKK